MDIKDDNWDGLDAFRHNVNSKPKYLRLALDILSRRQGYTNADVIDLAHNIDQVSHGYGNFGRLSEKDAQENWLDFIKRENAEGILSSDDFYYDNSVSDNGPTGIANPADYISKVSFEKDTNDDNDDNDDNADDGIDTYR